MRTYYVTTPIYYVNDRPHIGHCYTTLLADIAARFERLHRGDSHGKPEQERTVFFLTGTDEHAEKVVAAAAQRELTPQAWADRNAAEFRSAFDAMGFAYDDFVRTSEERHKLPASEYIQRLVDSGDIELGDYEGWYDPSQEEYLTETTAKESDFKSPVTGKPLEKRVEQNYFFRLDRYERELLDLIAPESGEPRLRILPDARRNEVLGRIRQGLQKVPVSRRVREDESGDAADWGIRMPNDPEHRIYVWIEALCNYMTVVDTPLRTRFWPATVHVMAKDILWFHAVIWPAMLLALGKGEEFRARFGAEQPADLAPRCVYAHAYWIREGRKMSKTLGNFIEIETLEAYAERYSLDALRWYLATQGPLGATDADFSHSHFVETYNADLANGIGNAVSRVGNMIHKYFDGLVPPEPASQDAWKAFAAEGEDEHDLASDAARNIDDAARAVSRFDLGGASRAGIGLAARVDGFINATRPFSIAKQIDKGEAGDPEASRRALATILYQCAEALRIATLLLAPAMPTKMAEVWRNWNCEPPGGVSLEELAKWGGDYSLKPGQRIEKGEALFMRADAEEPPPEPRK